MLPKNVYLLPFGMVLLSLNAVYKISNDEFMAEASA